MIMYFRTRKQARSFASKTQRKAPATKQENGWAVKLK